MKYVVLACTGLDKAEGSVAREVAIRLAEETGAEIVCPVVLNRTPARYKKTLAENRLIVVDGCATQCASKLAAAALMKPALKVLISGVLKKSGRTLEPELRLGPDALGFAQTIVDEVKATDAVESEETRTTGEVPNEVAFESPTDFAVVIHDKYEFRVPLKGYFFNANDVWAQVAGGKARVGISDYLQQRLTDITFVDPPKVGAAIAQFDEVGSVESSKAVFDVLSPATGTVVRINEIVADEPESINGDPYGSWIAELDLTAWEEDQELLVDGAAYAVDVKRKAAED
jgi:glycine cleavage system H protein